MKERFKRPGTGGQKGWDRYFIYVSTGVYGFVRHPMYLGGMLLFIGEAKMLVEELEGYGIIGRR